MSWSRSCAPCLSAPGHADPSDEARIMAAIPRRIPGVGDTPPGASGDSVRERNHRFYAYDNGRPHITHPDGTTTSAEYNAPAGAASVTDRRNTTYDDQGRLTLTTCPPDLRAHTTPRPRTTFTDRLNRVTRRLRRPRAGVDPRRLPVGVQFAGHRVASAPGQPRTPTTRRPPHRVRCGETTRFGCAVGLGTRRTRRSQHPPLLRRREPRRASSMPRRMRLTGSIPRAAAWRCGRGREAQVVRCCVDLRRHRAGARSLAQVR